LSLVELTKRITIDRTIDVLPMCGCAGTTLQFFVQEAIYGIKSQQQKARARSSNLLREYVPGLTADSSTEALGAAPKARCKEFRTSAIIKS